MITLNGFLNFDRINAFGDAFRLVIGHVRPSLEDFTLDARCEFVASAGACLLARQKKTDI